MESAWPLATSSAAVARSGAEKNSIAGKSLMTWRAIELWANSGNTIFISLL